VEKTIRDIVALRIAIARHGEMDRAKWWNTNSLLGKVGELALSRGFPKTHVMARSRVAFAVASARSDEVFDPPGSFTLWRLPVELEDRIEDAWSEWLENPDEWASFLNQLEHGSSKNVQATLAALEIVSPESVEKASRLRREDDLKSVPIRNVGGSAQQAVELLALAHSLSEPGKLALPFIRQEDFPA